MLYAAVRRGSNEASLADGCDHSPLQCSSWIRLPFASRYRAMHNVSSTASRGSGWVKSMTAGGGGSDSPIDSVPSRDEPTKRP